MLFINYHGQDSVHPDIGKNINEIEDKEEITYQKNKEIEPTDGRGLISFNEDYLQYSSSKFLSNSLLGIVVGFILLVSIPLFSALLFKIGQSYYYSDSQNLYDYVNFFIMFFIMIGVGVVFLYFKNKKILNMYICNGIVFDRKKEKVFIKSFDKSESEINYKDLKVYIVNIPNSCFYEIRFYKLDKGKVVSNTFALSCVSEKRKNNDLDYKIVLKAQWEFIRQYMDYTEINELSKYIKSDINFNKKYFLENIKATFDRYIGVPIIYEESEINQSAFKYVRSYNKEYAYWVSVVPKAINNHILGAFEFFGRFFVYFVNKKPNWNVDKKYNDYSFEGVKIIDRKKDITKKPPLNYMLKFIIWGVVSFYINIFVELWLLQSLFNAKVEGELFDFTSYLKFWNLF